MKKKDAPIKKYRVRGQMLEERVLEIQMTICGQGNRVAEAIQVLF